MRHLTAWPGPRRLQVLDLHINNIGDAGAVFLAGLPLLAQLRELNLGGNEIGDAGALALVSSPCLARMRALWLNYNPISEPVQQQLQTLLGDRLRL